MADEMAQRTKFPEGFDVLKRNGDLVQSLWNAVDHSSINRIPTIVREVITSGAWRKRKFRNKIYEHDKFLDFITVPPLAGCGWDPTKVEALLNNDVEVLAMWREATTGKPGRPSKENNDNVIIKSKQGNSRAYALDRLKRERPDLFDKVKLGKLSANAAAIEAGFRKLSTPLERILKLLPKLTPTECRQLQSRLNERIKPRGRAA
jgi:hypothetical protein